MQRSFYDFIKEHAHLVSRIDTRALVGDTA